MIKTVKDEVILSNKIKIDTLMFLNGLPKIVPICYSRVLVEFVMIEMEYCAGGSLEQFVKSRNRRIMYES